MIPDIMMALTIALILEFCRWIGKFFKQFIIIFSCMTIIVSYFIRGCQIDFIGTMDFSVWIAFIILFNEIIAILIDKINQKNNN